MPLALPGDEVTPEKFTSFWCDGSCGLYIHPNVWHGAVVPHADEAEFLDRQGRVHARVSVDFVKEFGCYLGASLATPASRRATDRRAGRARSGRGEDRPPVEDRVPQQPLVPAVQVPVQGVEVERDEVPLPDVEIHDRRAPDAGSPHPTPAR